MPDEDKTLSGSLVLDLRIWWRHVHTLYYNNKNPVELKHCETSSFSRVFYLMKLEPRKKG